MKLHSLDWQAAMPQAHDGPVTVAALHPSADFQFFG
jgi:hypothetical protein